MARTFLTPIDLSGLELLNARLQNLAAAPGSPGFGRAYYDTTLGYARVYSAAGWVDITPASAGYTDEQAQDAIAAMIAAGVHTGLTVTYNDASNSLSFAIPVDAVAGTASLRTLGNGAQQAVSGTDSRLSDQRTPTDNSVTNVKVPVGAAISADKIADGTTNGVYTLTERSKLAGIAAGATAYSDEAAQDAIAAAIAAGTQSGITITYNDAANSLTFSVAADAAAGTASLRTLGNGAQQAVSGTDSRLSDARTPSANSVVNASVATNAAISSDKLADGTTNGVYTLTERSKLAGIAAGATAYTNAMALANRLDQFAQPTSAVNFGGQRGTNAADPTGNTDLVTKQYADGLRQGIVIKDPVRVASTGNINIASPGATIDGVSMSTGNRFLAKNQTTGSENGIYVWNGAAVPATRATDADVSTELPEGATVWVQAGGTSNGGTRWVHTTTGAIVLGTTALVFTQDFAATSVTAGNGLTASGNAFNVVGGTGVTVAADSVSIDTAVVTRKANFDIGNGAATSFNLAHNFNTRDVQVQVWRNSTPWDTVEVDVTRPDANTVTLTFATAPAATAFRASVQG